MNLKTMTLAIALAFAAPVLAQSPGKTTTDPKDSNPAAPPATSASQERPASSAGSTSSPTTTTAPAPVTPAPSTAGAGASSGAPVSSGTNAADRPANTPKSETSAAGSSGSFSSLDRNNDGYISREEARDVPWNNRFSELDKDNDGRISQSEFNAMGSSTTGGMGGSVGPGGTQSGSSTSGVGDKPGQKQ